MIQRKLFGNIIDTRRFGYYDMSTNRYGIIDRIPRILK